MKDETVIRSVNYLLLVASALIFYGLTYIVSEDRTTQRLKYLPIKHRQWKYIQKAPELPELLPGTIEVIVTYTTTTIETEYIGTYFVTAYCPEECGGSWMTSSGATCYHSEDPNEPTTCAIDLRVHDYGDLLAIDFGDDLKVYEAQDTGPGVQGYWIDCFVETMDEVRGWPTGWFPVYSVTYKTHTYTTTEKRRNFNEYFNNHLFGDSFCSRDFCRDALGIDR